MTRSHAEPVYLPDSGDDLSDEATLSDAPTYYQPCRPPPPLPILVAQRALYATYRPADVSSQRLLPTFSPPMERLKIVKPSVRKRAAVHFDQRHIRDTESQITPPTCDADEEELLSDAPSPSESIDGSPSQISDEESSSDARPGATITRSATARGSGSQMVPETTKEAMFDTGELDELDESASGGDCRPSSSRAREAPRRSEPKGSANQPQAVIEQPEGGHGRPYSGGYNTEEALRERGWPPEKCKELKELVHRLIGEKLDTKKPYAKQNLSAIVALRAETVEQFPVLEKYAKQWPVNDLIMMRLNSMRIKGKRAKDSTTGRRAREAAADE